MAASALNRIVALVSIVVLTLGVSGCKREATQLTSAWPVAVMERIVPQPPEPARWPYRGTEAPDDRAIKKRPLSVKIENSPSSRPQTGLNSADVVYESVTEGGITRFNCIFQSDVPSDIGPVRSARFSDLWVVPQYDGLFFFSGASSTVNRAVNAAKIPNLSEDAGVSAPYYRSSSRSAPHNLYLDSKKGYAEAKKRGYAVTAVLEPLQYDKRRSAETTVEVTEVSIPFSQANKVRWEFDDGAGKWLRWNNGKVHKDAETGKQVAADNVVVLWAKYTPKSRDKVGSITYDIGLGGKGKATVFKHGRRYDVTWTADRDTPPRFKDADGKTVRLAPGTTWFQVIALDVNITMK